MAHSKGYINKDLTICGICLMVMEDPKALPCLHSYCLKCLSKWAEDQKGMVRCPICVQDCEIPPEGVKGFTTNVVVNTLKDRLELADKLHAKDARIPCSCCGATDCKVEAYCTECCGFICEDCGNTHKRVPVVQNHKTVPLADLQSGKVDIKTVMKQEYCKEHKGQVLRFYCKTCGVLICLECTVIDHPGSNHSLVNLNSATKEQILEINKLMTDCGQTRDLVENLLKSTEKVQNNLEADIQEAQADLHQVADAVRSDIQQKEKELEAKIIQAATDNKKQIDAQKDNLQLQQTRLHTALHMASEVTETGSEYDLALVYSSLKNSLTQLREMKPENVDYNLGQIKFTPNKYVLPDMPILGSLSVGSDQNQVPPTAQAKGANAKSPLTVSKVPSSGGVMKYNTGIWKMEMQYGMDILKYGRGIALTPMGDVIVTDVIVTDSTSLGTVYSYSQTGKLKFCIDTKQGLKSGTSSYPWNVVVSPDGTMFITHHVSHVNVHDTNGIFKYTFPAKSPSNVSSDAQNTRLWGLAMDNQRNLLVGDINQKYISKHSLDGSHISSFKVTITPWYISVTPDDHIIVSAGSTAYVLDTKGNILHTLDPPADVSSWSPRGLCCTSDNEIYIANRQSGSDGGIYCYSVSGQYLGCITKDVVNPAGIAVTDNGEKLLVVEDKSVKMLLRSDL